MSLVTNRRGWLRNLGLAGAGAISCSWSPLRVLSGTLPTAASGLIDATYHYELDIQSEGVVLLGPDEDIKRVAFQVNTDQTFSERAVISDGNRLVSRLYEKAELVKRFGVQTPETVTIGTTPLAVIAWPEEPDSGRMLFRSPQQPISLQVANLLQVPFSPMWLDELAVLLFQDKRKLTIGDRLSIPHDLAGKLFCLEDISENSIICEVEKANDTQAVLRIAGDATGRSLDTIAKLRMNASARAIFETQTLSQVRANYFEQREKGVVAPGYAVTTKLKLDQSLAQQPIEVEVVKQQINLLRSATTYLYRSGTNLIEFQHTPNWHLVLDQKGAMVWRLIVNGLPTSQCNILLPVTPMKEAITLSQFVTEVEASLQGVLGQVTKQQKLSGADGADVYCVEVTGKEEDIDLIWTYYLIAGDQGRRAQLVFTTEAGLIDAVGQGDRLIAGSLTWPSAAVAQRDGTVR